MAAKWRGKKSARRVLRKLTGVQDDLRRRPSPQVNTALRRHRKNIADILAGEKVIVRAKSAGKTARLRAAGARPLRGGRLQRSSFKDPLHPGRRKSAIHAWP